MTEHRGHLPARKHEKRNRGEAKASNSLRRTSRTSNQRRKVEANADNKRAHNTPAKVEVDALYKSARLKAEGKTERLIKMVLGARAGSSRHRRSQTIGQFDNKMKSEISFWQKKRTTK